MRRPERRHTAWWLGAALCLTFAAARAEEPALRFEAPITVTAPAAFVQLPLPASAYGHSLQPGLRDLLIVDAKSERVPFAILAPRAAEARSVEQQRDAVLYPLPAKPAPGGVWASPVEIAVQGDSISVRRLGRSTAGGAGSATAPTTRSGGWLIDLGERKRGEPPPQSLRMQWSGPEEFSAAFRFETSDDLRSWRAGGAGQLLAFRAASGPLTQPTILLPAGAGRFVRLVWADAAAAPIVNGAKLIAATHSSVAIDPPTELVFSTLPTTAAKASDEAAQHALHYDLGGLLPLVQIDLRLAPGTRVAPVRLQGRARDTEPWHELASYVFYRLERGGEVSHSPPLRLHTSVRYLRVLPDPRAAALDAGQTQLVVQAQLASLVFASQGQVPYMLRAGAAEKAAPAALPVTTLVPALDDERARFGRAALGEWREIADVARAADRQKQLAALRPWLLWAVLLAGVAGLAFMVWRLTRPARHPIEADA